MNIIVTGANKGLGLSLVKVFAGHGHCVAAGVYGGESGEQLRDLSAVYSGKVVAIPLDVTDETSMQIAVQRIHAVFEHVDLVISNAGVLMPGDGEGTIMEMEPGDLQRSLEVNAIGTIVVMRHFLPMVRDDGRGMLIFITSEAGSISNSGANFPAYSISKTAANKAVFILRATVGDRYKIYAMHPGRMNTDMGRKTAQIEPGEAAEGIYKIAAGIVAVEQTETGFINYMGKKMTI